MDNPRISSPLDPRRRMSSDHTDSTAIPLSVLGWVLIRDKQKYNYICSIRRQQSEGCRNGSSKYVPVLWWSLQHSGNPSWPARLALRRTGFDHARRPDVIL